MKTKFTQFISLIMFVFTFAAFTISAKPIVAAESESGGGGGGGSSPSPANLPMIHSEDDLRNYALGLVDHGSRSIYSDSMDWGYEGAVTDTDARGKSAEQVLDQLFAVDFVYRLKNPADEVRGNLYLRDKDNNALLYGNASFRGDEAAKYGIWLNEVPLPLSNVESAEVLALDEDGTTARRNSLTVRNGHPLLSPGYTGAPNGLLAVKFTDGTLATWELAKPNQIIPDKTMEKASYKVEAHYIVRETGPTAYVKGIETWQKPTVYIEVPEGSQDVTFDFLGLVQKGSVPEFERPYGFVATRVEDGVSFTNTEKWSGPGTVKFPIGTYRTKLLWDEFARKNRLYTGPEYGKGSVEAGSVSVPVSAGP